MQAKSILESALGSSLYTVPVMVFLRVRIVLA
jgi:hypothetical protein